MTNEEVERWAVEGDLSAVERVVTALKAYRKTFKSLLKARYRSGTIDGVCMHRFIDEIEVIEQQLTDEELR